MLTQISQPPCVLCLASYRLASKDQGSDGMPTRRTSVSPEEHAALTSSTPASFASIPTVLRRQQQNARVVFSPEWEGYGEGVSGSLYITEACVNCVPLLCAEARRPASRLLILRRPAALIISALCFVPASDSRPGFSLDYPSITLHAISRDDSGPSVYCQLDESPAPGQSVPRPTRIIEGRENDGHYHPEDEEDDDTPMREMRILVDESDGALLRMWAPGDARLTSLPFCWPLHLPSSRADIHRAVRVRLAPSVRL
jgi:hypothetical protein